MRFLAIIAGIPASCHGFVAWILYVSSYWFAGRERRRIQFNVATVYGLPAHSEFSKNFVRQNIMMQLMLTLETIKGIFWPAAIEILGAEEAKKTLNAACLNSGIILISAHVGSWELLGREVSKAVARPFYGLAKPSQSKWLTRILNEIREKMGAKVLWTDSPDLFQNMQNVTDSKGILGFIMDQRPKNRQSGHPCVFMGVPDSHIASGPVFMAVRKNLPVCGIYLARTGRCQYRIYVSEILTAGHGEVDHMKVAQLMVDDMSRIIKMFPEQWSWNYRRWK